MNLELFAGSKSHGKASIPAVVKDEKMLNPASRRVRDAAENLLSVVMEQVHIPANCPVSEGQFKTNVKYSKYKKLYKKKSLSPD